MVRITVIRAVFGKLSTQLGKRDNGPIKELLSQCKQTLDPKSNTILWGPSIPLMQGLCKVIIR